MKEKRELIKVLKMGPKLGIYLSKFPENIKIGDLVEIVFDKEGKEYVYLAKFNKILTLRVEVVDYLKLKHGEKIYFSIKKLDIVGRTKKLFYNHKIDFLYLIPEKSSNGYLIVCKSFSKCGEEWLTLWCFHSRGSCMQINLRRFLDIDTFGRLLGLMQAEGTKYNFMALEFANASLSEHKDFVDYLNHLGISNDLMSADCVYYSQIKKAKEVIDRYQKRTNVKIRNIYTGNISKYGLGFKLRVRSAIFSNIVLASMNKVRKILVESKWDNDLTKLANAFFAKLLSGDGNINLDTKDRNLPQGRIKITDGNIKYLQDYEKLMIRFGFKPRISQKYIMVRASFNLNQAKWLLQIGAFKNNPNEARLKTFIEARTNLNK